MPIFRMVSYFIFELSCSIYFVVVKICFSTFSNFFLKIGPVFAAQGLMLDPNADGALIRCWRVYYNTLILRLASGGLRPSVHTAINDLQKLLPRTHIHNTHTE